MEKINMTPDQLREQFEKETGENWWTNPVCHGETAFASWEYQAWLESHNASLTSELSTLRERMERVVEMLKWHYNPDADENDTSPADMVAHINGLCIKSLNRT